MDQPAVAYLVCRMFLGPKELGAGWMEAQEVQPGLVRSSHFIPRTIIHPDQPCRYLGARCYLWASHSSFSSSWLAWI